MSAHFAQIGKAGNIIPKGNQRYLQPRVHQPGAKTMDLGAFSCTVHAGEAYEGALFLFAVCLHCHAATIFPILKLQNSLLVGSAWTRTRKTNDSSNGNGGTYQHTGLYPKGTSSPLFCRRDDRAGRPGRRDPYAFLVRRCCRTYRCLTPVLPWSTRSAG